MDAKDKAREIWDKVNEWGTAKIGELSFMEQLAIATEPEKKAALLAEERAYAESIISAALAEKEAVMPISGKTKAQERDDIAIHMEMLCYDEMRADACADANEHDLPFQVFRILGGYGRALERLAEKEAEIARQWISMDDRWPEKGARVLIYCHPCEHFAGRMHVARFDPFQYYDSEGRLIPEVPEFSFPGFGGITASHWMPIPLPPDAPKEVKPSCATCLYYHQADQHNECKCEKPCSNWCQWAERIDGGRPID